MSSGGRLGRAATGCRLRTYDRGGTMRPSRKELCEASGYGCLQVYPDRQPYHPGSQPRRPVAGLQSIRRRNRLTWNVSDRRDGPRRPDGDPCSGVGEVESSRSSPLRRRGSECGQPQPPRTIVPWRGPEACVRAWARLGTSRAFALAAWMAGVSRRVRVARLGVRSSWPRGPRRPGDGGGDDPRRWWAMVLAPSRRVG